MGGQSPDVLVFSFQEANMKGKGRLNASSDSLDKFIGFKLLGLGYESKGYDNIGEIMLFIFAKESITVEFVKRYFKKFTTDSQGAMAGAIKNKGSIRTKVVIN